jgi:hypothetical protein
VTADDGVMKKGRPNPIYAPNDLRYHMRHGGGRHAVGGQLGMYFPLPPGIYPWLSEAAPAPSMPPGGLVVGGTEHRIGGHLAGLANHALAQSAEQVALRRAMHTQLRAAGASEPTRHQPLQFSSYDNEFLPSLPGAIPPGQPLSGIPSPGRPGPGQSASPSR